MKGPRQLCAIFPVLLFLSAVHAQTGWTPPPEVRSVSGQFQVTAISGFSPLMHQPVIATNPDIVRLNPTLAAVSAERLKTALASELGRKPGEAWRGKIFVVLHPAGIGNDFPAITAEPFLQRRDYRLELPDILTRQKFARSLVAVQLLELADREAGGTGHPAEVPAWLADGLARKIVAGDRENTILTLPAGVVDGLSQSRSAETLRGFDAYAETRQTLRETPVLTFQQLSWPVPAQLSGADGEGYFASAHLFVGELLSLKNGPAKLRNFLARLPACENWQTAFFAAFHDDFSRPLEVEKWWALRVVAFAAHAAGPQWTAEVSQARLDDILRVPVEFRRASNSLPEHAEISLQEALRTLVPAQQEPVLRNRLRDLELAQLRLFPAFASVAAGYCQVLADFLGDRKKNHVIASRGKHPAAGNRQPNLTGMVKKLDALDARRHRVENNLNLRPATGSRFASRS